MRRSRGRMIVGAASLLVVAVALGAAWLASRRPDPVALLARAQAEFQAGRLDAARATLDRLATARPPQAMDRMARAQVAQAQGRLDDALAEAGAIFDDPALGPLARLLAGRVEVARHRLRPAEAHFLKAAEGLTAEPQPYQELAYIYNLQHRQADFDRVMLALSDRRALTFERLLHWGKARHANWNPREDCEVLAACVAADPDDRTSRLVLADGLYRLNDVAEADAALAPLPPGDPDAAALRASFAIERGRDEEAERLIRDLPQDEPAAAEVRARLALKRGDAAVAVASFRRALEARPNDRGLLHGLGTALRLAGDAEAAAECLRTAERHDAVSPLILRAATTEGSRDASLPPRLSAACAAAGRLPEALAWARLALADNPLDRDAQEAVFRLERQVGER